jgi:hypothetical protein
MRQTCRAQSPRLAKPNRPGTDRFEYQMEHNPEFLRRIYRAREDVRVVWAVRLEDVRN